MTQRRKVRWLIAHFPLELFVRAAKAFEEEIEQLCPGQFDIEIHTMNSWLNWYKDELTEEQFAALGFNAPKIANLEDPSRTGGDKHHKTFTDLRGHWQLMFDLLKQQKFEMSQTQINIVGSHLDSKFHAVDLPYLFNDHDHVSRVLDGEIGQDLSDKVAENTGVRALGYTYSGGFRIIGSTDGIECLNDLDAKKFVSFTSPSSMMFKFANVKHLPRAYTTAQDIGDMNEEGGAIETTYLRFAGKNVLKSNHSMFMTAILTSEDFLATLTEEQRDAFKEAAHRVAKVERIWSIEDAEKYEQQAEERGVKIVDISKDDELRLRAAALQVYKPQNLARMGIDGEIVKQIIAKRKG